MVLERSLSYIYENIRDYWVFEKHATIVGACALHIVGWQDLGEIKSLVVAKQHQRKGIGRCLVEVCLEEARSLGIKKVFTLTFIPSFFKKFGFKKTKMQKLPHKIWSDCLHCVFFPDCKEEALMRTVRGSRS